MCLGFYWRLFKYLVEKDQILGESPPISSSTMKKSVNVFEASNFFKQRMSLKPQQQKLKAPRDLNQRKLFLCFLSIHWEKQKQQGLPQLKEMRDQ
jgi:hypothetical protein